MTASLREFEVTLSRGEDADRCWDILTMLWRWQRDPDLTAESRGRAGDLVHRFARQYARHRRGDGR